MIMLEVEGDALLTFDSSVLTVPPLGLGLIELARGPPASAKKELGVGLGLTKLDILATSRKHGLQRDRGVVGHVLQVDHEKLMDDRPIGPLR